jgi:hypothetical protein
MEQEQLPVVKRMPIVKREDVPKEPKLVSPRDAVMGTAFELGVHFFRCIYYPHYECTCENTFQRGYRLCLVDYAGEYGKSGCSSLSIFRTFGEKDVNATTQAIITNVTNAKEWFEEITKEYGFDFGIVIEKPTEENCRNIAIELVNLYSDRIRNSNSNLV